MSKTAKKEKVSKEVGKRILRSTSYSIDIYSLDGCSLDEATTVLKEAFARYEPPFTKKGGKRVRVDSMHIVVPDVGDTLEIHVCREETDAEMKWRWVRV